MKKIRYVVRPYIHKSGRVMVRVRWNKCKCEVSFSTGKSADPEKWNKDAYRAKANTTHMVNGESYTAKEINGSIECLADIISQSFYKFDVEKKIPTNQELKKEVDSRLDEQYGGKRVLVLPEDDGKTTLNDLYKEFVEKRPNEINWGPKAAYRYREVVDKYLNFSHKDDVRLADINKTSLTLFKIWFFDPKVHKKPYSNYTVIKHFRNLKGMLRWGRDNGFHVSAESLSFNSHVQTIRKTVTYLEYEEIQKLAEYKFPTSKRYLDHIRDVFCFSCYTSLRHSDLYALRKANIKGDMMEIVTQKTDDLLHIPLIPQAKAILEKYKNQDGDKALPVVSDQKSNMYIKEAARIAGLDREMVEVNMVGNRRVEVVNKLYDTISMHDGRRSFVVNSLAFGIPANVVQKCTGHSDIQTMRAYIATSDNSVKKEMKKWNIRPLRQKIDAILDEASEDRLLEIYEMLVLPT